MQSMNLKVHNIGKSWTLNNLCKMNLSLGNK